jgi:hypothetical protein
MDVDLSFAFASLGGCPEKQSLFVVGITCSSEVPMGGNVSSFLTLQQPVNTLTITF